VIKKKAVWPGPRPTIHKFSEWPRGFWRTTLNGFTTPTSAWTTGTAASKLARAYALAGDSAKAKTAYQDFLALWKDADPDIPVLKQAKAEYAKLQ
jgi:hypothetical protein